MRALQYWHFSLMSLQPGAMYQMSGDKQMFPLSLKKVKKYDAANYRPVSLTCICCKTLEHILASNINKRLALDSILADCQHGFRSQRSFETQLVQFVHDIISNLDGAVNHGHKQTDLIIIDFAKAFDKVPHRTSPMLLFSSGLFDHVITILTTCLFIVLGTKPSAQCNGH